MLRQKQLILTTRKYLHFVNVQQELKHSNCTVNAWPRFLFNPACSINLCKILPYMASRLLGMQLLISWIFALKFGFFYQTKF